MTVPRPRRAVSHSRHRAGDRGIDDDGNEYRAGAVVDAIDRHVVWLDDATLARLKAHVGLDVRVEAACGDVVVGEVRHDPLAGHYVRIAVPLHPRCGRVRVRPPRREQRG